MLSIPKHTRIELPKLRRSAKVAPHCFGCWRLNLGETVLVLAHYNWPDGGKGVGLKCHDGLGAILCGHSGGCHDKVDNRVPGLSIEERKALWNVAHVRTLGWWLENGYLR